MVGKYNIILVSLNLVVLSIFISIRLYTGDYIARVDMQTRHSVEKIRPMSSVSTHLATLLSLTTDSDIKRQLHSLKEMVDYSSNVSQSFQENLQNQFLLQLNQIQSLIVEHKPKMKY